jgi:hypothetical protein
MKSFPFVLVGLSFLSAIASYGFCVPTAVISNVAAAPPFATCHCPNSHSITFNCGACSTQILDESHTTGDCSNPPDCQPVSQCSSSVNYLIYGPAPCSGNPTAQCQTSCGGTCTSSPRCAVLTVTCAECTQF